MGPRDRAAPRLQASRSSPPAHESTPGSVYSRGLHVDAQAAGPGGLRGHRADAGDPGAAEERGGRAAPSTSHRLSTVLLEVKVTASIAPGLQLDRERLHGFPRRAGGVS